MNLLPITCYLLPANCSLFPVPCSLLAIDSATSILSVAVSHNGQIFYKEDTSAAKQSESVMLIIDNLMKEADLKPADLNGVICMRGRASGGCGGSFTGLRIGYSIAKGLALSLSIPFIAVPAPEEIIKEGGSYFYREKRGYARELLEIGMTMDFTDNTALFSGPEY